MEFVCDNVTILEAWNVASSQQMEFAVVKCWLVVQRWCKCVILAPLHMYSSQITILGVVACFTVEYGPTTY